MVYEFATSVLDRFRPNLLRPSPSAFRWSTGEGSPPEFLSA